MNIYLPIAEMSVNVAVFLGMGCAVGFLSGLFGVGGGFLLTPLLIFMGIPSAVAVGTGSMQIVASSVSGAIAQYRRNNVDIKMGVVLVAGGVVGAVIGVGLVKILRQIGQFDLFVSLSYVTFLGAVGGLDAHRERRRDPQGALGPNRGIAQDGAAQLGARAALQDALPPVEALHQRRAAGSDRGLRGLHGRVDGRRRRLRDGAGHDLSVCACRPASSSAPRCSRSCS